MSEPFDRETDPVEESVNVLGEVAQQFTVKAVETIHRDYVVLADNEAQAADRLRRYFADPGMVATGVVARKDEGERVRWRIPSGERTDAS